MQMMVAEPENENERNDNDPDLIGFLRIEGSAVCEVSYFWYHNVYKIKPKIYILWPSF